MFLKKEIADITNEIQEACDKGIFACGVFVDFKRAYDTVNHNILLDKLNHYGMRRTESNWFKSYLGTRQQYTIVNSFSSKYAYNRYDVPQGSILGPLLFWISVNNLNKGIRFSTDHHFADDTNLTISDKSLQKVNKHSNHDLKLLNTWLRANRISLDESKTEIILLRPKSRANITKYVNFRISDQ